MPTLPDRSNDTLPTRASLLGRLKQWDDQPGWQEFYQTYRGLIRAFALKAGLTETEAEDVVQETMVSLAKTMPTFEYKPAECSFKTWLLHLTRKRIADQFRKRPAEVRLVNSPGLETKRTGTAENAPDPVEPALNVIWDEEWENHLMTAALEKLRRQAKPKQFQIYYLHVVRKLSTAEVSSALGVNIGQIYLAKHRLGRLFRKILTELRAAAM